MAKSLATPEVRADIDTAELMELTWKPADKHLEMKICMMNAAEGKALKVLRHVMAEADYDAMMDAMGDAGKDLKTQLEDALWADAEAKGLLVLA